MSLLLTKTFLSKLHKQTTILLTVRCVPYVPLPSLCPRLPPCVPSVLSVPSVSCVPCVPCVNCVPVSLVWPLCTLKHLRPLCLPVIPCITLCSPVLPCVTLSYSVLL